MKIDKNQYQQGDLIAIKLTETPNGEFKIIAKKKCILAHGENGHYHVVEDDEAELIQIGEKMLLKLQKEATIKHDEHFPITLEPGIWQIGQVVEKDWLSGMVSKVVD